MPLSENDRARWQEHLLPGIDQPPNHNSPFALVGILCNKPHYWVAELPLT
jgi:hypothetical protein